MLAAVIKITLACFLLVGNVCAETVEVKREGRTFSIAMEVPIDASPESAVAVLSKLSEYHLLHHAITASTVTYKPPKYKPRLRTEVHSCVWFFCKDMAWLGEVSIVNFGHWQAKTLKKRKTSFSTGITEWGIRQQDDDVLFFFDSTFTIGFWVPPVIGEWLIKGKLEKETVELAENIAKLAQEYEDNKSK